jgi:tripartite-type tricarboxylate transporter receptor subunit TctC
MMKRRFLLTATTVAVGSQIGLVNADAQSAWPNRPLRFVVGFSPGSTPDLVARTVGEPLARLIGQPVVVENRPGAGGNIAADLVAKARDEHTVGVMININLTVARLLNPSLPYDPRRDLAPVCLVGITPFILALSPNWMKNKADIDRLRLEGNRLNYGSVGIGSMAHLGMELLSARIGMGPQHIPYPGNPQVLAALAAGEIDLALVPAGIAMQQVRTGKIGALAVTSTHRSAIAAEVPTLVELGIKGVEIEGWTAFAVAAAMPEPHRRKLAELVSTVIRFPEVQERLIQQGWDVVAAPAEALARRIDEESTTLAAIIEAGQIRAN